MRRVYTKPDEDGLDTSAVGYTEQKQLIFPGSLRADSGGDGPSGSLPLRLADTGWRDTFRNNSGTQMRPSAADAAVPGSLRV